VSIARFALVRARTRLKQIRTVCQAVARKQIGFYPPFVERFEQRFAAYVGRQHGLSFCNGTSAIEAALFAAKIAEGDEVIVPSCTFHSSIDPIVNAGATPVFADIDRKTLTICPADLERKITRRTKAVIVVHLFGIPARMDRLLSTTRDRGLVLIEDVSHAHGASWESRKCGSFGEFGIFSLQGGKAVGSGEGGIVVTDDSAAYIRMSMWGHFTRHAERFAEIGMDEFRFTGVGYKRRMAPIGALVADADLDYLDRVNQIMSANACLLDSELSEVDGVATVTPAPQAARGGFFQGYPLLITKPGVNARDAIVTLRRNGIAANAYPFALHHQLAVYVDKELRGLLLRQEPAVKKPTVSAVTLPGTEWVATQLLLFSRKYLVTLNRSSLHTMKTALRSL
jgi:dTDP-4-amino-4,6-dideoxygalactose transaminase